MRLTTFLVIIFVFGALFISAQENFDEDKKEETAKTPVPEKIDFKKGLQNGGQVAESVILVYSGLRGRGGLGQIRKTTVEIGKFKLTNPDGTTSEANYTKTIKRGENLEKEQIRLDQKFPSAEYALIYDGEKIFGMFDNTVFEPRADALKSFQNRIWHSLEALMRYNENGSTVKLNGKKTVMGVELYHITLTDKQQRKTDYYVSVKSLRVKMLEYEAEGVKYRRKFYDQNPAQGTLVPYRSVLWADEKIVEEQTISTITFGQTIDESIFASS